MSACLTPARLVPGEVGVAWGAVVEGLVGSDGVVDVAEPADLDGQGEAARDIADYARL